MEATADKWETDSEDLIDAVARSIADATESWEEFHTQQRRVRWEAGYFLKKLQERGYAVVAQPKEG